MARPEAEELFPFIRVGSWTSRIAGAALVALLLAFVAWGGWHEYGALRPALRPVYLGAWAVVLVWGGVAGWRQRVLRREAPPLSRGTRWALNGAGVALMVGGEALLGLPVLSGPYAGILWGMAAHRPALGQEPTGGVVPSLRDDPSA